MNLLTNQTDVLEIVAASHRDPFAVLGMHASAQDEVAVRTFQPDASAVEVIDRGSGEVAGTLSLRHQSGFFDGRIPGRTERFDYYLRLTNAENVSWTIEDPYRFPSQLGELDLHLLGEGTHLDSYRRLGAHVKLIDGVAGTNFAVWAPNAIRVAVIGDFNQWDGRRHPMRHHPANGVWDLFLPGVTEGALYKFEVRGADGAVQPLKADPYAFATQHPPETASVVATLPATSGAEVSWTVNRATIQDHRGPISIYEVHLGSWRRHPADNSYFSYRELAATLIPYVVDLGFTHIELLPINEYPFDGSWGYQPIGLFAPTRRFGAPEDFRFLIEQCHQAGLGVLLDWVPGHFPNDAHGLSSFDGTRLYEHADPRQGQHRDWGTLIYNYGRREVANFLLSNALFWIDQYGLDGLRVDAVASMLYLDYSREPGDWIPNRFGGRENLEAVDFLRRLNEVVYRRCPGVITVAEESTAWPGVSRATDSGGLGFGFKWNMGWMHDTLDYLSQDPVHRRWHQDKLTFGLLYAFSENFVLPLSHDEVVHGKGSLLTKMPGDDWQKFANLRSLFAFMWTYPGKKLLFMGGEFGQRREWNHDLGLDWHLLDDHRHRGVHHLIRDLNTLLRDLPALHERDGDAGGFVWVDCRDQENSVIAYLRLGGETAAPVLVVCNFTPVPRPGYRIGVPTGGFWSERLNTDADIYGGSGIGNLGGLTADPVPCHGHPFSLPLILPPLATLVLV